MPVTNTAERVTWIPATDNVGVVQYLVYNNDALVQFPAGTPTKYFYGFGGLACGTNYTTRVVAKDLAGNASTSVSRPYTTLACGGSDNEPPGLATNVTATQITKTSARISWTAPTDNVRLAMYRIYNSGKWWQFPALNPPKSTYGITGLSCGTLYSASVVVTDPTGNSSMSLQRPYVTQAC